MTSLCQPHHSQRRERASQGVHLSYLSFFRAPFQHRRRDSVLGLEFASEAHSNHDRDATGNMDCDRDGDDIRCVKRTIGERTCLPTKKP